MIDGRTRMLCLIGSPVAHSGSPAMYNYSFEKLGVNYVYVAFDVKKEETGEVIKSLKLLGARGFNVTMPCKQAALAACDRVDAAAALIGAVNTVVNDDGILTGYNTDGLGWVRACREAGLDLAGRKMVLAGAGGAASAIAITAAMSGLKELALFARKSGSFERAEELADKIRRNVPGCTVTLGNLEDKSSLYSAIADADVFTNATSVGMKPHEDTTLIEDTSVLRPEQFVSDVVYNPKTTRLLADARVAGCRTLDGLDMLLWQGAEAFRLYTGLEMPAAEVRERFFS